MSKVLHLDNTNFNQEVIETKGVVLVDFWAAWCGPCKMIGPILDELSEEMDNAKITKVNVDEAQDLAGEYGIRSIPTLIIFKDGEKAETIIGLQQKEVLKSKIQEYL